SPPRRGRRIRGTKSRLVRFRTSRGLRLRRARSSSRARMATEGERERISTGCAGLDNILGGGLDPDRVYLVEGRPGSGKTTIAMQFLLEGVKQGERVLYVSMSETRRELELVANRHGWSLKGLDIFELVPAESTLDMEKE